MLFDSDWDEISKNININDSVDKRPRSFFYAARNFKDYMRSLLNREIPVEIYIGHVKKNEAEDKGIDDLLTNTLGGKEDLLKKDISQLINEKDKEGEYLKLYKITSYNSDAKLEELWGLNNPKIFASRHIEDLRNLPLFRIGRHKWRINEKGELESAQPIESDEQYWEEIIKTDRSGGNPRRTYEFNYVRCFRFLRNRGYGRYRMLDDSDVFVHVTQHEVRTVRHTDIRDFISEFTVTAANEDVLNMLYRGGPQYLGPDKLSNLHYVEPNFEKPVRDIQRFYFDKTCWQITADNINEIEYTEITHQIWADQKQSFQPKLLNTPLIYINKENEKFSYELTEDGKKAHFLQFLINTSNFTWRKQEQQDTESTLDIEEKKREEEENTQHFIAKLSAIGYLLLTAKDRNTAKAVIAMDGKQSEVGQSNGRTGKSIIGEMLKHILPTVFINGKAKDIETDNFLWDAVTEKTKIVFIDDVRTNFNIEFLFPNLTGDWNVNYKGGRRAIIPFNLSPKVYIPTNHALNGKGDSFADRLWIIAFSDFYSGSHKPQDDFGCLFFDEWDFTQWNYLWNLIAVCVQTYLKYGVIQSPSERIEIRKLRQEMGETFLMWADDYFSDQTKLNTQIKRMEMYENFKNQFPTEVRYMTAHGFKERIKSYCKWKGYTFNPHRYDPKTGEPLYHDKDGNPVLDHKTGGVEYFVIGESTYNIQINKTDDEERPF